MRACELDLLRGNGAEPCLLMDTGGETGRISFSEAGLALRSNRNLLRNWYFVDPVNQMGLTEYMGLGYTINGWKNQSDNCSLSVQSDGIVFEYTGDNNGVFTTPFIAKEAGLFPGTIATLSFLAKVESSSNGRISVQLDNDVRKSWLGKSHPVTIGQTELYSCTATIPDIYQSGDTARATIYSDHAAVKVRLYAAKLEPGPYQTLAHKDANGNWVLNDPPPDKALELAKCRMYQVVYKNADCIGFSAGKAIFIYKPYMRADPVVVQNDAILSTISGDIALNTLTVINAKQSGSFVVLTSQTNDFGTGQVYVKFDSPARLILDSNL